MSPLLIVISVLLLLVAFTGSRWKHWYDVGTEVWYHGWPAGMLEKGGSGFLERKKRIWRTLTFLLSICLVLLVVGYLYSTGKIVV